MRETLRAIGSLRDARNMLSRRGQHAVQSKSMVPLSAATSAALETAISRVSLKSYQNIVIGGVGCLFEVVGTT
jgi:hypothetical protein